MATVLTRPSLPQKDLALLCAQRRQPHKRARSEPHLSRVPALSLRLRANSDESSVSVRSLHIPTKGEWRRASAVSFERDAFLCDRSRLLSTRIDPLPLFLI